MEGIFRFLTPADLRVIHGKVQLARAQPGQFLLQEGKPPSALFLIRSGKAIVQRRRFDMDIPIAELGQNEMFGETAFLDGIDATASVVAKTELDVLAFTPARLSIVFEQDPGIFGRFHKSLAWLISRRLRKANELAGGDPFTERFGQIPNWELI